MFAGDSYSLLSSYFVVNDLTGHQIYSLMIILDGFFPLSAGMLV
jgi:hypothetical protein